MPFFRFEHRYGDSNDCSVSEGYVEAPTQWEAFAALDRFIAAQVPADRVINRDSLEDESAIIYLPADFCEDGEECRADRCSKDHRTFHSTFRHIATEADQPDHALSRFHAWDGEITQA